MLSSSAAMGATAPAFRKPPSRTGKSQMSFRSSEAIFLPVPNASGAGDMDKNDRLLRPFADCINL